MLEFLRRNIGMGLTFNQDQEYAFKQTLKLLASHVLHSPSLEEKLATAEMIGEYTDALASDRQKLSEIKSKIEAFEKELAAKYPSIATDPSQYVPQTPARDTKLKFDINKEMAFYEATDKKTLLLRRIESAYLDVEIGALEVSCVLYLMGSDQPLEFYLDFGTHIRDEARHAQLLKKLHQTLGQELIPHSYSNRVWRRVAHGNSLVEKIMVENVIEEGWACDVTTNQIKNLKQQGFLEASEVYAAINDDEVRHAAIGNKWVMKLLANDQQKYLEIYLDLSHKIHPESKKVHNPEIRKMAGFSDEFISRYYTQNMNQYSLPELRVIEESHKVILKNNYAELVLEGAMAVEVWNSVRESHSIQECLGKLDKKMELTEEDQLWVKDFIISLADKEFVIPA